MKVLSVIRRFFLVRLFAHLVSQPRYFTHIRADRISEVPKRIRQRLGIGEPEHSAACRLGQGNAVSKVGSPNLV